MAIELEPRQTAAQALRAAIENLYVTFERYPLRRHVAGCPCCVKPEDQERLRGKPLRALTAEDLTKYAFKALTTWGSERDFKSLLPRLLELLAWDWDRLPVNTEIVLGKLAYGQWTRWPRREQEAVMAYLQAWWRHVLESSPSCPDPGEALCSIAQAVEDLTPFLGIWRRCESPSAAFRLAEFVNADVGRVLQNKALLNPFWERRAPQMAQVIDWLRDPATREALEDAFFRYADQPFAEELAEASDRLQWLRP